MGQMRSVDMFLNFQVGDANRNVLWRNREAVPSKQLERMTKFWGDESWKDVAYSPSAQGDLFGEPDEEKATNEQIAEAFRKRLQEVAGFRYVLKPVAMRNKQKAIIYFLFFASHKPVAQNIVKDIFRQYEGRS